MWHTNIWNIILYKTHSHKSLQDWFLSTLGSSQVTVVYAHKIHRNIFEQVSCVFYLHHWLELEWTHAYLEVPYFSSLKSFLAFTIFFHSGSPSWALYLYIILAHFSLEKHSFVAKRSCLTIAIFCWKISTAGFISSLGIFCLPSYYRIVGAIFVHIPDGFTSSLLGPMLYHFSFSLSSTFIFLVQIP